MNDELLKEIALRYRDDILYPYDSMMDVIGFEAICAISDAFHGTAIYVPDKTRIFGKCLEKQIILDFDGCYKSTARRFNCSERQIRAVIYNHKIANKNNPPTI